MPQPPEPYLLHVNEKTSIEVNPKVLPKNFYQLNEFQKDSVARKIVIEHIDLLEKERQPPTAKDFLIPIGILLPLAAIMIFLARRIKNNPKLYDRLVKPNED